MQQAGRHQLGFDWRTTPQMLAVQQGAHTTMGSLQVNLTLTCVYGSFWKKGWPLPLVLADDSWPLLLLVRLLLAWLLLNLLPNKAPARHMSSECSNTLLQQLVGKMHSVFPPSLPSNF
jgi:hypothetical protein